MKEQNARDVAPLISVPFDYSDPANVTEFKSCQTVIISFQHFTYVLYDIVIPHFLDETLLIFTQNYKRTQKQ